MNLNKLSLQSQMFESVVDNWTIACKPHAFKLIWEASQPNTLPITTLDKFKSAGIPVELRIMLGAKAPEGAGKYQENTFMADPIAGANLFINLLQPFVDRWPYFLRYQVLNETGIDSWASRHAAFVAALAPLMRNKGWDGVFINVPTGNPAHPAGFPKYEDNPASWKAELLRQWEPYFPALDAILKYQHFLGLNEYAPGYPMSKDAFFHQLRHRVVLEVLPVKYKNIPIILGEVGIDRGEAYATGQRGWKATCSSEQYGKELSWLSHELAKDTNIKDGYIFGAHIPYFDSTFSVAGDPNVQKAIQEYIPEGEINVNLLKVGLRWNPSNETMPVSIIPKSTLSINITTKQSCNNIAIAKNAGHNTYVLFGTEARGAGYEFSESGLRQFLSAYGAFIDALTVNNEWNDWGNPLYTQPENVRIINAWGAKVCKEFNIQFAICSTLTHSFNVGLNDGFEDLMKVYPTAADIPEGAWIDVHMYTSPYTEDGQPADPYELATNHLKWWTEGRYDYNTGKFIASPYSNCKLVIGEFGTAIEDHIPVFNMFASLLEEQKVQAAMYFCLQDFNDPNKTYGLLGPGGNKKAGNFDSYDYAARQFNGGDIPVPTDRPKFSPAQFTPTKPLVAIFMPSGQTYNKYIGGQFENNENSATEWITVHTDGQGGIISRCANKSFNGIALLPALEYTTADAGILIPQSIAIAKAYANAYPNTQFVLINFHTDAGLDQHFGALYNSTYANSKKVGDAILAKLAVVHGKPAKYNLDEKGQGYYALPDNLPTNLTPILIEAASHEGGINVRWIEANVDTIAGAFADGVETYATGTVIPPNPTTPCEEELVTTKKELANTRAQLISTQAALNAANTKIANAKAALA